MELGLSGKTFVLTGAAHGLGAAIARRACEEGAHVAVADADADAGAATADRLRADGFTSTFYSCDVTDADQVRRLMDGVAKDFGGIDVLVNNAGVHERQLADDTDLETMPIEVFDRVVAINLRGVWLASKYATEHLKRSTNASIINAGSTAGLVGHPHSTAYGATKGGVVRLTQDLAVDLARYGIRVNCYCPGAMRTRMVTDHLQKQQDPDEAARRQVETHLVHRLGDPMEVADLVCFLASERARFLNGIAVRTDGGSLSWRGTVEMLDWPSQPSGPASPAAGLPGRRDFGGQE